MFKAQSQIAIENSIFINNENKIQQTKQIVIIGHISDRKKTENWLITKS